VSVISKGRNKFGQGDRLVKGHFWSYWTFGTWK